MKIRIYIRSIVLGTMLSFSCGLYAQEAESEWFSSGKKAYTEDDYELAKSMFERELQRDKTNGMAWLYLAAVYRDTQETDSIVYAANQAIRYLPKEKGEELSQAYIMRGTGRLVNEDHDGAIDDFERAKEMDPFQSACYMYEAFALDQKGERDEATRQLQEMIKVPGSDKSGGMGVLSTRLMESDPQKAMEYIDKAIELDRTKAEYYVQRGKLKIQAGQKQEGVNDIVHAFSLDVSSNNMEEVSSLAEEDDMRQMVMAAIERERVTHGDQTVWEHLLAEVYEKSNDETEALRHAIRAARISPTPQLLIKLARRLDSNNMNEEATFVAREAFAKTDHENGGSVYENAFTQLMDSEMSALHLEQAVADMKQYIEEGKDTDPANTVILAVCQYYAGQNEDALATMENLSEDYKTANEVLLLRGKIMRDCGMSNEARELFQTVAADEDASLFIRVQGYALAGDKDNAGKLYKEWLEEHTQEDDSMSASDYFKQATMLTDLGDRAMAVDCLRRCMENSKPMRPQIELDEDFRPLHGYADYEKLISEYRKRDEHDTAPLRQVLTEEWPEMFKK